MNNQQRGDLVGVSWVAFGGAVAVTLPVHDQDLDLTALLLDVTSVLSGGNRARLGGLGDAAATIACVYDADASPYLSVPNIVPGNGGFLIFNIAVAGTRFFTLPMRVEKLHWKSGIESAVMYNFDAKMDSRLGAIVFPSA